MLIVSSTLRDRSIILTGYKDAPQWRLPPVGCANDRGSTQPTFLMLTPDRAETALKSD